MLTADGEDDLEGYLDRLLSACSSQNNSAYSFAYRQAFATGPALVEPISRRLLSADWALPKEPLAFRWFTALFTLAHELDETAAQDIANTLQKKKCHATVVSEIRRISALAVKTYDIEDIGDLRIYWNRDLPYIDFIQRKMRRYLMMAPPDHLQGIEVLFVMPKGGCGDDALGFFDSDFQRICVSWGDDGTSRFPLMKNMGATFAAKTLFHEIGHHVLGHAGGGQQEDREEAVDEYANRLMAREVFSMLNAVGKRVVPVIDLFYRKTAITNSNWNDRLLEYWSAENVAVEPPLCSTEISRFEELHNLKTPGGLGRLLTSANGMSAGQTDSNGFRFRNHDEFEVVPLARESDEMNNADRLLVFADHYPNAVRYSIPLSDRESKYLPVIRDQCKTPSGHLRITDSMGRFIWYLKRNHPFLFA